MMESTGATVKAGTAFRFAIKAAGLPVGFAAGPLQSIPCNVWPLPLATSFQTTAAVSLNAIRPLAPTTTKRVLLHANPSIHDGEAAAVLVQVTPSALFSSWPVALV